MAIFARTKPSPPSASGATDAMEQTAQVTESATAEKDTVAETASGKDESKDDDKINKKDKADAGLGSFFVRLLNLLHMRK